MGDSYDRSSIVSGFHNNGQIDKRKIHLPSVESIIGTYCGPISKDHCLYDSKSLISKFYEETLMNGQIEESSFDKHDIIYDMDSQGNKVCRDFSISQENCQRSKVLSADVQRFARIQMQHNIKEQLEKKSLNHATMSQRNIARI
jgi:hypothetical protein